MTAQNKPPFDPTKPVQLSTGEKARIICTDRKGDYPIVALCGEDEKIVKPFDMHGRVYFSHERLVNVPEICVFWINLYHGNTHSLHSDCEDADSYTRAYTSRTRIGHARRVELPLYEDETP